MKLIAIFYLCFLTLPGMGQLKNISDGVYKWEDHPVTHGDLKESRKIFEGKSPHFEYLKIHATTQYPGATPGKAHASEDMEECVIVTEGQMKITIEGESRILGPAGVFLLMPTQSHSIENIGDTNLTYFVLKYRSKKEMDLERGMTAGGSLMLNADSLALTQKGNRATRRYFDRSTAMCERFEMHVTFLNKKGPSHESHKHNETEIIFVLSGETEMNIGGIEYQAKRGDFYFMTSPSEHAVRNASDKPCSYFAFKWN